MKTAYSRYYQILGIQPGCTWLDLKEKYRQIVKEWHPDRFHNQPKKKEIAEEKIKEVNRAYDSLSNYYKKFGTLPITAHETTLFGRPASKSPASRTDTRSSPFDSQTSSSDAWKNKSMRVPRALLFVTTIVIAYFSWQFLMDGQMLSARPDQSKNQKYFLVGSSLSEVRAIQGMPSKIEFGIWYYGKSKVYFVNEMVIGWENNASIPLKVAVAPTPPPTPAATYFTIGSTKAEVNAVQGKPLSKGENEWNYGVSNVYFEGGRVTGWHNSIYNPLKIHKKDQN